MADEEITYEKLCERYSPAIAAFLIKEIEKADRQAEAANQNETPVQSFLAKAVTK